MSSADEGKAAGRTGTGAVDNEALSVPGTPQLRHGTIAVPHPLVPQQFRCGLRVAHDATA
jgi:hypothetical protein